MAAIFEGVFDAKFELFLLACGVVMLAPLAFFMAERCSATYSLRLVATSVFFDMLSFTIIKQMLGVFACTRSDLWHGNEKLCEVESGSCMDMFPEQSCFSNFHMPFIFTSMVCLTFYYLAAMHYNCVFLQMQSVVLTDEKFAVLSMQFRVIMAYLASSIGTCYPWTMVLSTFIVVVSLLAVSVRRHYSNVLLVNAVCNTGLVIALINCVHASYILVDLGEENRAMQCEIYVDGYLAPDVMARPTSYTAFWRFLVMNCVAMIIVPTLTWVGFKRWLSQESDGDAAHGLDHDHDQDNHGGALVCLDTDGYKTFDCEGIEHDPQAGYAALRHRIAATTTEEGFDVYASQYGVSGRILAIDGIENKEYLLVENSIISGQQIAFPTLDMIFFGHRDACLPRHCHVHLKDIDPVGTKGGRTAIKFVHDMLKHLKKGSRWQCCRRQVIPRKLTIECVPMCRLK
jgi:hypothetical protein